MVQARVEKRRRKQRVAVLRVPPTERSAVDRPPLRAVRGTILDAGPQFLVLWTVGGELRVPLAPDTGVWHGDDAGFTALRPGRQAIVRPSADGLSAERIWVDITRVAGTIISTGRGTVEVDAGPHRGRQTVTIEDRNLSQVLVRHPRFEPGYLLDLICLRSTDGPRAVHPGTYQPGYRADTIPPRGLPGPLRHQVQGTVTWYDGPPPVERSRRRDRGERPGDAAGPAGGARRLDAPEPARAPEQAGALQAAGALGAAGALEPREAAEPIRVGNRPGTATGTVTVTRVGGRITTTSRLREVRGAAYPAVDPEGAAGGCGGAPASCAPLPYLSRYSELFVRNECTRRATALPVIECGCTAARFSDRCVECGISPRGRIAELTALSFVDLGGDLSAGCFNATLTVG